MAPIIAAAGVAFKDIDRALLFNARDVGPWSADGDGVASDGDAAAELVEGGPIERHKLLALDPGSGRRVAEEEIGRPTRHGVYAGVGSCSDEHVPADGDSLAEMIVHRTVAGDEGAIDQQHLRACS